MNNSRLPRNGPLFFLLTILTVMIQIFISEAETKIPSNSSVSTILVFGDSTVDPGNNNYINTVFRSNFPPYGQSLANHLPTGRFTDGKLTTDYIASYIGIKDYVPPYLNPMLSLHELMTGVSFASAGSGHDPLTAQLSGVLTMSEQLEYFKEYVSRLEQAIGKKRSQILITKAVFFISSGTNDFVVNYFMVPIRNQLYSVSGYEHFLVQQCRNFIQALWDNGARRIGIVGLPPMGCLPAVITVNSINALLDRRCIESFSSAAKGYNQLLENEVKAMQRSFSEQGGRIAYADIYTPLDSMIHSGHKYGFDTVSSGCCGSGLLETSYLCNHASPVCPEVSKYVFWDSIHPTTKAYNILFDTCKSVIDGLIKN